MSASNPILISNPESPLDDENFIGPDIKYIHVRLEKENWPAMIAALATLCVECVTLCEHIRYLESINKDSTEGH